MLTSFYAVCICNFANVKDIVILFEINVLL